MSDLNTLTGIAVSKGEELYSIVFQRVLDFDAIEASILDIYGDLKASSSLPVDVDTVFTIFQEQVYDVISTFGEMAGYDGTAIDYALQKWEYESWSKVVWVEQVLAKYNAYEFEAHAPVALIAGRIETIHPQQNVLFPQFI